MEQSPLAPDYVVTSSGIDGPGGLLKRGTPVPPGTYDAEQLARLVGLGAIEPVDPPAFEGPEEYSPAALAPKSAEEYKARLDAAALASLTGSTAAADSPATSDVAMTGEPPAADGDFLASVSGLSATQRDSLKAAGYDTRDAVSAASDEELDAVDGIGPSAVEVLRRAAE